MPNRAGPTAKAGPSSIDWISNLKLLVAALKSTSTFVPVPVPCLPAIFEAVSTLLDLVERVGQNETDMKYLAESAINITSLLTDELKSRPESSDMRLTALCNDFLRYLEKVDVELNKRVKSKLWFKRYLKAKSIRDAVDDFARRIADLRADLTLAAAIGSRFQLIDTDKRVQEVQSSLAHITHDLRSHAASFKDIEEDVLLFKPSELHLDFDTVHLSIVTLGQRVGEAQADQKCVKVRMYGAKVGSAKVATARVYDGEHADQMWRRDLELFSAHLRVPGIAQIYGMCKSPRLQALIFHDELVPIDIYAATLNSPVRIIHFELNLIRNFTSVFLHIATVIGVGDTDYRETVADLALISRSTGSLVISHLPYNLNNTTMPDVSISEKQLGGPVHAWFSSCGCLARVPQVPAIFESSNALVSPRACRREPHESPLLFCSTIGILSRYRGLLLKGVNFPHLKMGSIYLQRPGELEVVHTIAEISDSDTEIIVEDWATRNGVFEELPGGWTRFEVDLKPDRSEPGYYLSCYGSVYMPVPEREAHRAGWLMQAHSLLSQSDVFEHGWGCEDMLIAELFFVNLDWQLVPEAGTYEIDDLPLKIYVFVENIPVDGRGRVSRPITFWSTHPDGNTADVPSHFHYEAWFSARGSGRSWESHHYEAARTLQEKDGFDSSTSAAADSLALPRYKLSAPPVPEK
ncbi:hypothetical protein B0H11DRAFT_2143030 [Mycena galericulata]|nr:hypothetical protein B0H11DRAFT_2143030 [Mycena galericulata]